MEEKLEITATLQGMINTQTEIAKRYEIVSKGGTPTKDKDGQEPTFAGKGKYDPGLLEPRHIAIQLGISVASLERLILDSENVETVELGNDYKKFRIEVMLYDDMFGQIRPQLAEFSLQLFDKTASTTTDVIFKIDDTQTANLKVEISRLQKEVEFIKNGKV